eukprot:TRINITY_DN1784_c0_g3_i2.p5 TRINITY_DN1784_c0_g3~~TRINITY_DN1784_c0_g3_i2.p5  ORF type:complete len:126 (-),score=8.20 TRINITY_DN1784_c0_g3_i2:1556-1933(-)
MRIVLYDADDRSHLADLKKQEYIGEAEFMMHELMRAKAQTLKLDLKNEKGKKTGAVILQAEQLKERLSSNIAQIVVMQYETHIKTGWQIQFEQGQILPVFREQDRNTLYFPPGSYPRNYLIHTSL